MHWRRAIFYGVLMMDHVRYMNQLEPNALIDSFLAYPPYDFTVLKDTDVLAFSAKFDLLTTADDGFRQTLQKIPLFSYWRKWLRIQTCFVGTTVSEYCIFSKGQSAEQLVDTIQAMLVQHYALTIVKDIPQQSPLLSDEENLYSASLVNALKKQGFIMVEGQALAWVPIDFVDSDEYLQRLSKSRRKDMRRKLKKWEDVTVHQRQTGDDYFSNAQVLAQYYELYLNVFNQSEIHFDQLSREFFEQILQDQLSNGIVFEYYANDELIGYNICYILNGNLVDKYVGFIYPAAREYNLYYLSWFYNLDYAAKQRLKNYIAGWTDPEIKAYLGASFTFTQHAVHVRNPILRAILKPLSKYFESDQLALEKLS